jgi:Xaa-Pro aminopeptidase
MARTASVGKPNKETVKYSNATIAGINNCKEIMKPGVRVCDVFNSAIDVIRNNGLPNFDRHHIGHGIGLACYDYPLISPSNTQVLEENMVINIETPYYLIGYGASHFEDTLLITSNGCECLQSMKLDLKVLKT